MTDMLRRKPGFIFGDASPELLNVLVDIAVKYGLNLVAAHLLLDLLVEFIMIVVGHDVSERISVVGQGRTGKQARHPPERVGPCRRSNRMECLHGLFEYL